MLINSRSSPKDSQGEVFGITSFRHQKFHFTFAVENWSVEWMSNSWHALRTKVLLAKKSDETPLCPLKNSHKIFKKEDNISVYLKKNWQVFPCIFFLYRHIDRFIFTEQILYACVVVDISHSRPVISKFSDIADIQLTWQQVQVAHMSEIIMPLLNKERAELVFC